GGPVGVTGPLTTDTAPLSSACECMLGPDVNRMSSPGRLVFVARSSHCAATFLPAAARHRTTERISLSRGSHQPEKKTGQAFFRGPRRRRHGAEAAPVRRGDGHRFPAER